MKWHKQEKYELLADQELETMWLYPFPNHSRNCDTQNQEYQIYYGGR